MQAAVTAAATAGASRLDNLIHELFDEEDTGTEQKFDTNDTDVVEKFRCDAETQLQAGSSPRNGASQTRRDFGCFEDGSGNHPLLNTLKASMTNCQRHQRAQISSSCNDIPGTGPAAQAAATTGQVIHPLPGLTIVRGVLSPVQQLGVAAAILKSGCLAGEGAGEGVDSGDSRGGGDDGAATGAGCGGSVRPTGQPNQAMFFGDLPAWALHLTEMLPLGKLLPADLASRRPSFDQAIVNLYRPGEGIRSHVDLARFQDGIVSVSIGGPAVMHFTRCPDPRFCADSAGGGGSCAFGAAGGESCPYRRSGEVRPGAQPPLPKGPAAQVQAAEGQVAEEQAAEQQAETWISGQQQQQHLKSRQEAEPLAPPARKRQRCDLAEAEDPVLPVSPRPDSLPLPREDAEDEYARQHQQQQHHQDQDRRGASSTRPGQCEGQEQLQRPPRPPDMIPPPATPPPNSFNAQRPQQNPPLLPPPPQRHHVGLRRLDPCLQQPTGEGPPCASGILRAAASGTGAVGTNRATRNPTAVGGGSGTAGPQPRPESGGGSGSLDEAVWWCSPDHLCVLLQGGDLLGMAGEARYGWEHGIRPVVSEIWGETGCDRCKAAAEAAAAAAPAGPAAGGGSAEGASSPPVPIARGVRLSITLRRLCPDIVLCAM